jgi:hypothetical protein
MREPQVGDIYRDFEHTVEITEIDHVFRCPYYCEEVGGDNIIMLENLEGYEWLWWYQSPLWKTLHGV